MPGTILVGDCREQLATLPAQSVHCVVTSPPYWGLRDYGVSGQIGLEQTPEGYVAELVGVFREVWRVLRDDGCAFLNLGDSFSSGGRTGHGTRVGYKQQTNRGMCGENDPPRPPQPTDLKPKDLVGIPWRVAFALQADRWYLRSDIIWSKPNPMPESVTDRPTCSHEYVFLLTKRERYFFDAVAVREKSAGAWDSAKGFSAGGKRGAAGHSFFTGAETHKTGRQTGRNIRSVWTIPTRSFAAAHFATFPPALVEPCVKAGTSERGCCPQCGKQWERVVEREKHPSRNMEAQREQARASTGRTDGHISGPGGMCDATRTVGFRPACVCGCPEPGMRPDDWDLVATPTGEREGEDPSLLVGRAGYSRPRHPAEGSRPITRYEQRQYADQLKASPHKGSMAHEAGEAFAHYTRTDNSGARPIPPDLLARWLERGWLTSVVLPEYEPPEPSPCVVLDPFFGAGTVGLVCEQLGRDWIGVELNPEYAKLAQDRITAGGDLRGKIDAEKQEAAGQLSIFDA